jgi:ribosome recycling factor
MNEIKKADLPEDVQKDTEDDIQKLTDSFIEEIDKIYSGKEKEIMTV